MGTWRARAGASGIRIGVEALYGVKGLRVAVARGLGPGLPICCRRVFREIYIYPGHPSLGSQGLRSLVLTAAKPTSLITEGMLSRVMSGARNPQYICSGVDRRLSFLQLQSSATQCHGCVKALQIGGPYQARPGPRDADYLGPNMWNYNPQGPKYPKLWSIYI